MNRSPILVLILVLAGLGLCWGQVGGNISYSGAGGRARAEQAEHAKRVLTKEELPPTGTSTFVEASVLMNVKADEYVAVFAVAVEGETVANCGHKMETTLGAFVGGLKPLGVGADDLFVDFIAQNKIYGFEVAGDVAREKLVGFELKKNVSIRFKDYALLDKIIAAAARAEIFDLVKVDYVVADTNKVQDRLVDEAARVIKQKSARYERLLGIKLQAPAQVVAERPAIHYPSRLYDTYTAAEGEEMNAGAYRQKYAIQSARKTRTFFYNGLDADGFDAVINPAPLEPAVQFTLYLKVKYEVEPVRAK